MLTARYTTTRGDLLRFYVYNYLHSWGLARAHETDTGKAVMAVLLPIIVCCGGAMLIAILGGFGALSQFSRQ